MNYYERHLGDYARDAGHLTMIEHGAYTVLLDRYYTTEAGIPADQAYRVARARTKEEKQAVDAVLNEFFTLQDEVWINWRAEEEIAKAMVKINSARENGKKGGRPKVAEKETKEKPIGFSVGSENETQKKAHQTPDTRLQTPSISVVEGSSTHTELYSERDSQACVPTPAGLVCKRVIEIGIDPTTCNPGNPTLQALLDAGATMAEFEGAARAAAEKHKPFNYVIGIVKRQREEAANMVLHKGNLPQSASGGFDEREYGKEVVSL